MNKIAGMKFTYIFVGGGDSQKRMELAYDRVFDLAWKRLQLASKSTLEYTQDNGTSGRVSNSGGGGGADESKKDYRLPDVQVGQNTGSEVWESLESEQSIIYPAVPRKGD